ncbi:hypothetical protein ACLOJK_038332 [Asimina triloba]
MRRIPKLDHVSTLTNRDNREIFKRSFDTGAWALKILKDLYPIKLRRICENAALGLELELNGEGGGPRELRGLNERIHLIDRCSMWSEYRYFVFEEGTLLEVRRHHMGDVYRVVGLKRSIVDLSNAWNAVLQAWDQAIGEAAMMGKVRQGLEKELVETRAAKDTTIIEAKKARWLATQAEAFVGRLFEQVEAL